MRFDALKSGNCRQILRIFGSDQIGLWALKQALTDLGASRTSSVSIGSIKDIESDGKAELTLVSAQFDECIVQLTDSSWEWRLKKCTWNEVVDLMQPFFVAEPQPGFVWLEGPEATWHRSGQIGLLLSTYPQGNW